MRTVVCSRFSVKNLLQCEQGHDTNRFLPVSGEEVWGLFWGQGAVPLFNDPEAESGLSTLDWPHGDLWKTERVQAFGDKPPSFTITVNNYFP